MSLLEELVKELPEQGGWPELESDVAIPAYFRDKSVCWFFSMDGKHSYFQREGVIVTRRQYEKALAASKPEWNGEGLPPVGCDCEYQDSNTNKWYPVTIQYVSEQLIVICGVTNILGEEQKTEIAKDIIRDKPQFRPIRSEADKKKEAAIKAIDDAQSQVFDQELTFSEYLYDAIAAGKIPHIRID